MLELKVNDMSKTKPWEDIVAEAKDSGKGFPMILAIVLTNVDTYKDLDAVDICDIVGAKDSYTHIIRSLLKVPDCLEELGYKITKL